MTEEAQQLIIAIQQMEGSLVDERANGQYYLDQDDLRVTYPLNRCLMSLREKHGAMSKLHRERFEQVKSKQLPHSPEELPANDHRTCRGSGIIRFPSRRELSFD